MFQVKNEKKNNISRLSNTFFFGVL